MGMRARILLGGYLMCACRHVRGFESYGFPGGGGQTRVMLVFASGHVCMVQRGSVHRVLLLHDVPLHAI